MATPPQQPYPAQGAPSAQGNPYAAQGGYGNPQAAQGDYVPNGPAYGQNPYGQNPHGQNPYGQQAPDPATVCRICAAQPARKMTIRQHTGLFIAMEFAKSKGPLCRSCATGLHRQMTAKTMAGGWWSPLSLFVFTPLTLLWNLYVRVRISRLPQPTPSPVGVVMEQGKPIFHRPLSYVGVVMSLGLISLLVLPRLGG
ncbi:hypothetical protein ACFV6E_09995 [Streptomyces sp. NPDC059785]|uniref:hypothetical protein n=1 Tax=Streptomyces sp. NPDC059785 TaxID=3346945 RepID=UPI00365D91F8